MANLLLKLGFIFLVTNLISCQQKTSPMQTKILEKRYTGMEPRISNNLEFKLNILTKLNSNYVFPYVIGEDEKVGLWLLTRQSIESYNKNSTNPITKILYDPRSLPRNASLVNDYACLPSEQTCNQLSINQFDINDVGVYTFRFDRYLTLKTFTFNVSAYLDSIAILCSNMSSDSKCVYDSASQTLSVLADEPVSLKCGIRVVQNDQYPISAQFNFISELYGEECMGNTTLTELDPNQANPNNPNYNVLLKELSKNCTRTFTKQDLSKTYSCQLNPLINSGEPNDYQQTKAYESLDIKLDVQYGPDPTLPLESIPPTSMNLFNKTQMIGENSNQKFVCPFIGNPSPIYYWRIVSVPTNGTKSGPGTNTLTISTEFQPSDSKEYTVPNDFRVGSYSFECKAGVKGMIDRNSSVVRFNLKMIAPPLPPKKKMSVNSESLSVKRQNDVNLGGIIGGVIGGLALLIIVAIIIIAAIRIRKTRNPKDELEKAKELDIDITDHNDLNTRKTNLVQQQQQQQVKQQLGNKVIAGLMMPNSTAQAYASIAHAAAAAAQSNQQKNNTGSFMVNQANSELMNNFNTTSTTMGSSNNLLNNNLLTSNTKTQSYNNPGFFESASYSIQNPLESPPPYDAALHQPIKKDSPIQQQRQQQFINQQHKDYMGSNTRLISGSNTPIQQHKYQMNPTKTQSYTANTQNNLTLMNSTPTISSSLQQLQYHNQPSQQQQSANLQYTSVHNIENRARSRNPLNGSADMENQQQYTTMAAQLSSNPIDV